MAISPWASLKDAKKMLLDRLTSGFTPFGRRAFRKSRLKIGFPSTQELDFEIPFHPI
jgi:hypothetical protein